MKSLLRPRRAPIVVRVMPPEWEPIWSDLVRARQGLDEAAVGLVALQEQLDLTQSAIVDEAVWRLTELRRLMACIYVLFATNTSPSRAVVAAGAAATTAYAPTVSAPAITASVPVGV